MTVKVIRTGARLRGAELDEPYPGPEDGDAAFSAWLIRFYLAPPIVQGPHIQTVASFGTHLHNFTAAMNRQHGKAALAEQFKKLVDAFNQASIQIPEYEPRSKPRDLRSKKTKQQEPAYVKLTKPKRR